MTLCPVTWFEQTEAACFEIALFLACSAAETLTLDSPGGNDIIISFENYALHTYDCFAFWLLGGMT